VFFCFLLPLRQGRQSVSLRKRDRFAPSSASFFLLAQKETKDAPGFGSGGAFQLLFAKRPNPDYYGRAELRCLRLLSAARRFACAFVYGRHALLCLVKMFLPPNAPLLKYAEALMFLGKRKSIHTPPQKRRAHTKAFARDGRPRPSESGG
jgi:hypothetical protein